MPKNSISLTLKRDKYLSPQGPNIQTRISLPPLHFERLCQRTKLAQGMDLETAGGREIAWVTQTKNFDQNQATLSAGYFCLWGVKRCRPHVARRAVSPLSGRWRGIGGFCFSVPVLLVISPLDCPRQSPGLTALPRRCPSSWGRGSRDLSG